MRKQQLILMNAIRERYLSCFHFFLVKRLFVKSDYSRHLFSTIVSFAGLEPTIFVGRGTHLILPREEALAVRIICNREKRLKRLENTMRLSVSEAEAELKRIDKEQREFFKKHMAKKMLLHMNLTW